MINSPHLSARPAGGAHAAHARKLNAFFAKLRQQTSVSSLELSRFFDRFEQDYAQARSTRAAATPHLDVLGIFGLQFAELRHSDVLAWFLDPHAEHEQGALFADALLELAGCKRVPSERYSVKRERHDRTDVAFYAGPHFAVFIENKVRHFERDKQVSEMVDSLVRLSHDLSIPRERRFAIFLTDAGAQPITGPTGDSSEFLMKNLKALRRIEIFEAFRAALAESAVYSPLLMNFVESYLGAIRRLRAQLT